jgi:sugar transferase (PEP-CTERM/EpsH1 system associated)
MNVMAMPSMVDDPRPLVVHVMHAFDIGGLENGVVNLINRMPHDSYRHTVLALTRITEFRARVRRDDVEFIALGKGPGHAIRLYPRLHALFRKLRPAIVHTRNLAALEVAMPAWSAGVPVRLHGEHGRDVGDLDGSNRKYQRVRRLYRPFVTHQVALSRDLARYLVERVGVPRAQVTQLYNGVDAALFAPAGQRAAIPGCPFAGAGLWIVGTVGRMQAVKDPQNLVRAFVRALAIEPALRARLRLVMVGDGALYGEVNAMLARAGVQDLAWLPGERDDVADVLRGLDAFVLPSLAEGVSNTILEAMACGLPVIATDVGGNGELVVEGRTGTLVPAADAEALARAIVAQARDPVAARAQGTAGRERVLSTFSLDAMVDGYRRLYDTLRARRSPQPFVDTAARVPLADR